MSSTTEHHSHAPLSQSTAANASSSTPRPLPPLFHSQPLPTTKVPPSHFVAEIPPSSGLVPSSSRGDASRDASRDSKESKDRDNKVKREQQQQQRASYASAHRRPNDNVPWGSRNSDIFEYISQIGEGTYGQVYKARNKQNGDIVALKKVRMDNEKEGFPITAIREIKILKQLDHPNVVKLHEIVVSKASEIFMVFEFMDHDLTGLVESRPRDYFSAGQIKCYMKQLLEGLFYCHSNNVIHRDIKGSNLLINNKGQLKLADFGLARPYSTNVHNYTNRVITLWYRPPELLLGTSAYGPAIDMWSVGCILAELIQRKPLFPGHNEIQELELIFKICGTPRPDTWPDFEKLPWLELMPQTKYKPRLREHFKDIQAEALDLIESLLCLDPAKRLTAAQALDHDYFWTDPMPLNPSDLPIYPMESHEYSVKKRQRRDQQHPQSKRPRDSYSATASDGSSAFPRSSVGNSGISGNSSTSSQQQQSSRPAAPPHLMQHHDFLPNDTQSMGSNSNAKYISNASLGQSSTSGQLRPQMHGNVGPPSSHRGPAHVSSSYSSSGSRRESDMR